MFALVVHYSLKVHRGRKRKGECCEESKREYVVFSVWFGAYRHWWRRVWYSFGHVSAHVAAHYMCEMCVVLVCGARVCLCVWWMGVCIVTSLHM